MFQVNLKYFLTIFYETWGMWLCPINALGFKSLIEAIDTTSPTGNFFFHVTGAFAELERNIIKERTKAGLEAAKVRGKIGGRPKIISSDKIRVPYLFIIRMNLQSQKFANY